MNQATYWFVMDCFAVTIAASFAVAAVGAVATLLRMLWNEWRR